MRFTVAQITMAALVFRARRHWEISIEGVRTQILGVSLDAHFSST